MNKKIKIIISGDNISRLLSRILIIFNRRNIFIQKINIYESKIHNNKIYYSYNIYIKCIEDKINNIIKQLEKLIGVLKVIYQIIEK